jgi:GNAT superfamily N-acetyltransferase
LLLGEVALHIRKADENDLPALAGVFAASAEDLLTRYRPDNTDLWPVNADASLPVYRHLHATGAVFVAVDPEPVGFAAAILRDGVWFLSQLWVLPDRQGSGIGSALLDEALIWGEGSSAFTVVSSPHPGAQTLYLRRSMYPLWMQVDLFGEAGDAGELPDGFGELSDDDQPWLDEIDREVRGVARPMDHAFWRESATGVGFRREGRPGGYVYVWPPGGWASQPRSKIGPGGVLDPRDMPRLVSAALQLSGGAVSVAIPSTNWSALNELVRADFRLSVTNTFMASQAMPDASRYLSSGGSLA